MWGLPTESQAIRREYGVACLTFVIGFLAVGAAAIYLHVRYVIPEDGWWGIIGCIRFLLEYPLLAGLVLAGGSFALLNRRHQQLGIYHCTCCGRPLQYRQPCACLPEWFHRARRKRSAWRHYKRRIIPVLALYLLFTPPAFGLALLIERVHPHPFAQAILAAHWTICMALFVTIEISLDIAKALGRGRRFGKRWAVFSRVFSAYPLFLVLFAAVWGIIRTTAS